LTAAAGGSQTIRFERFTFQASSSAGGIDDVAMHAVFIIVEIALLAVIMLAYGKE